LAEHHDADARAARIAFVSWPSSARAISATVIPGIMLSAAIRARSAFVRRSLPLGPSITSSREIPTPIKPSKWTPILPSLSKSNSSATHLREECTDHVSNGRRGSASRLRLFPFAALLSGRWRPAEDPAFGRILLWLAVWAGLWLVHAPVIGVSPAP